MKFIVIIFFILSTVALLTLGIPPLSRDPKRSNALIFEASREFLDLDIPDSDIKNIRLIENNIEIVQRNENRNFIISEMFRTHKKIATSEGIFTFVEEFLSREKVYHLNTTVVLLPGEKLVISNIDTSFNLYSTLFGLLKHQYETKNLIQVETNHTITESEISFASEMHSWKIGAGNSSILYSDNSIGALLIHGIKNKKMLPHGIVLNTAQVANRTKKLIYEEFKNSIYKRQIHENVILDDHFHKHKAHSSDSGSAQCLTKNPKVVTFSPKNIRCCDGEKDTLILNDDYTQVIRKHNYARTLEKVIIDVAANKSLLAIHIPESIGSAVTWKGLDALYHPFLASHDIQLLSVARTMVEQSNKHQTPIALLIKNDGNDEFFSNNFIKGHEKHKTISSYTAIMAHPYYNFPESKFTSQQELLQHFFSYPSGCIQERNSSYYFASTQDMRMLFDRNNYAIIPNNDAIAPYWEGDTNTLYEMLLDYKTNLSKSRSTDEDHEK